MRSSGCLNGEWYAKILALWDKMDARSREGWTMPPDEQPANLRARWGW